MNGKPFQTCPLISLLRRQLPPQGEAFGNPYNPQFIIPAEGNAAPPAIAGGAAVII